MVKLAAFAGKKNSSSSETGNGRSCCSLKPDGYFCECNGEDFAAFNLIRCPTTVGQRAHVHANPK
jgi:hypothetical protein